MLEVNGITIDDARVEIEVTSATGKITAYASTLDNKTSDPMLISPVVTSAVGGTRYVLPGIAFFNTGFASWRSDVRLFNATSARTNATITYYPQGSPSSSLSKPVTLEGGEVKALDNVLANYFGIAEANAGGSLVVTTEGNSAIVATARTYTDSDAGTYGQFIPGVTPNESVGVNDRALQLLQLEQSTRFRTNIGLAETTGNGATVEVSLILPDSKITPKVPITLQANEFRQISLAGFGVGNAVYNARVTVKVTNGNGKVTAYGSVIDSITQDPTYVPAQ
jgi:hypothetical protein